MNQINIESSDEEGVGEGKVPVGAAKKKGKLPFKQKREKGLRPVRVEGLEHKERVVSVNMESSSSRSAALREQAQGKAGEDNALFVEEEDESQSKEGGPRIKEEPADEDQPMTDAIPHADEVISIDDGQLPEQQVKVRRKLAAKEPPRAEEPQVNDPRRLLRTAEEIEEFERHEHDLDEIKKLFTADEEKPKEPRPEPQPSTEGAEEPTEQEKPREEEEESKNKLAGHLFLMQFPPVTPNLVAPSVEGEGGATQTDQQPAEGAANNQPEPTPVKQEPNGEVQEDGQQTTAEPPKVVSAADWQLPVGRVGKMNVHASGRVTFDWGGINFELDRSVDVDFLQEAVIMGSPGEEEEESKVWSMGQVSGKFTVMPDWEKML